VPLVDEEKRGPGINYICPCTMALKKKAQYTFRYITLFSVMNE